MHKAPGIVRSSKISFQISAVFPYRAVLENVRVSPQRALGGSYDFWRSERLLSVYDARARQLLADVHFEAYEAVPAGLLLYGRKRALEIATTLATTLARDPEMLLLDEPTVGMTQEDVANVVGLIRRVRLGRTILMVEHNLSVVSGLSDVITALTRGQVLVEGGLMPSVVANPDVRAAYLGSEEAG